MAPASVLTTELKVPELYDSDEAHKVLEQLTESFGAAPRGRSHILRVSIDNEAVQVPAYLMDFFTGVLEEVARGNAVTVGGIDPELTTQQAADLLKVSRPYLVKLIDTDQLPHRRVGNRRKVLLADILDYKRNDDLYRRRVLDELTREAEDLQLDY